MSQEPAQEEPQKCLKRVQQSSDPSDVIVEGTFKDLLADKDKNMSLMFLRSNIGVGLQSLSDSLPKYSEKDLLVVHRRTDKGVWKNEVWTKRDFEALEIQFCPCSSQLKDSHLMGTAHAVLALPKHGSGAHPENLCLALDGRGRTMLAHKDTIDTSEHQGSLYWAITRTSKEAEANLTLEMVTQEITVKLSLPGPKRRRTVSSHTDHQDLPQIPIMVNPQAIKKHTLLAILFTPPPTGQQKTKVPEGKGP